LKFNLVFLPSAGSARIVSISAMESVSAFNIASESVLLIYFANYFLTSLAF
jgi:hypothetical protein